MYVFYLDDNEKKVIISLIYVSIVLTIPLAVACQGVNFTYQCYELQR